MEKDNQSLRIAVIVGRFPALSQTFIINQVIGLIDRGHEVDILSHGRQKADLKVHDNYYKYNLQGRVTQLPRKAGSKLVIFGQLIRLLLSNGYKDPMTALSFLNIFRYVRGHDVIKKAFRILPLLGKQPYDIIHCQFGLTGKAFLNFKDMDIFKDAKLVVSFRGSDICIHPKKHGPHVYDELFRVGDLFLPVCEIFKKYLVELGCDPQKIVIFHTGLDCSKFHFRQRTLNDTETIRIVTIGRLVEKKGIEYGIRAMAKLAATHNNIEFLVIGEGPLKNDLLKTVEDYDLQKTVKLLGRKTHEEIIEILDTAHIFIATSVTAKDGNQDGPVNTLKEAMGSGLPVIGTEHGGIPELVEDQISGFLVPERDSEAITTALQYLIENSSEWPRFSKAGRARVETQYNLESLNDELVKLYEELVDRE